MEISWHDFSCDSDIEKNLDPTHPKPSAFWGAEAEGTIRNLIGGRLQHDV